MSTNRRDKHHAGRGYWLYGRHPVIHALNNSDRELIELLLTESSKQFFEESGMSPAKLKVPYRIVSNESIQMLLPYGTTHQGVALHTKPLEARYLKEVLLGINSQGKNGRSLLLICDQITDPHNFGAIIRSAAAFGVDALVVPERNQALESASVAKAACGMLEVVPIATVVNIADAMRTLKDAGYWTIGLDANASDDLHVAQKFDKIALVLGAEGEGMRRLTIKNCDLLVKIPMNKRAESLNVSAATAVALYALAKDNI
ncbi:MAG: 23S rRNA (guanosine(2251)-2'-O)-methyltransferase RlmB [Proteobacteria bacterium]|nr:23S rRNA (guanosine(2251)-2'-O)-methyltransferase RlmB [Pseudomonadota bacterium]